ncbi:hypothetical protein CBR_g29441 [Chara braunii]|uniref:Sm domain-containing protein n=1 Tax=Chara braunii TaxID=69332 RepID=A0A388LAE1_CHABU|nr:hypothetical protein CBR_g29441 [Chara braunii]|eukprot:GBG79291.1 hypothetical protein CBR_g29441 [Chara braunii]
MAEDFPCDMPLSGEAVVAVPTAPGAPIIVPSEEKTLVKKVRLLLHRQFQIGVGDGRTFVGKFHCLDKQGNILLADAVEYRQTSSDFCDAGGEKDDSKKEELSVPGRQPLRPQMEQRSLGLVLIPAKAQVSCKLVTRMDDKMAHLSLNP